MEARFPDQILALKSRTAIQESEKNFQPATDVLSMPLLLPVNLSGTQPQEGGLMRSFDS